MNKTGELPEDFYNFSGLRHLSQKGIEILEFYTTFNVIPVELQQFFKRTIDYYSLRKQRDGELDLYAELPYYLRAWDDMEEDEPQLTSAAQSANDNDDSRSEGNDFPGYDPAASACDGASTPLHDPFDSDSPASPLFHAPSSPALNSNGYGDPLSSSSYREEEVHLQEYHIRNEEDSELQEQPSVALIGDGTFYCPFEILEEPMPAENISPPVEVADSKEFVVQERSASNQSPTITSSVLEAESHQHSDDVEPESTPSGSADSIATPSSSLFQGIQEFLHEEANLTLILPVAPPSPTDLKIDESAESTAGDDGDEVTTKPVEHREENLPEQTECTPPAPLPLEEPEPDQSEEEKEESEEESEEEQVDCSKQAETASTSNPATAIEAADDVEMDLILETQEDEAKDVVKDKEEPPRKKRRISWNESSAESAESDAVDSAAVDTSCIAPTAPPTVLPTEIGKPGNSRPTSDLPNLPSIPRSSNSTSSVEKPKPNDTVGTTKNLQGGTSPSTSTAPPVAHPREDEKEENASSPPSPPPIPTSSSTKSNAAVATNRKVHTAQPAHHQRQHRAPPTNNIPVFTPTRRLHNFKINQPPPPFQPMNGPFSHPPPNMMGGGYPINNMQGPPLQQMGGPFQQQNMRPYQPPGPGPWNSQWVSLATWSPPNGPPQFTPNAHWSPLGPFGPLSAQPMMGGPPGNAFVAGQFENFCAFCDSMQPHASEDCGRFGTYASREARAREMNLCPHCLGKHNPRCCVAAQRPCPNCGKHNSHVAFCLYRQ